MRLADILDGSAGLEAVREPSVRYFLGYARVSTDMQERAGLSIPAQVREMHEYGEAHDIVLVDLYQEAESAFCDESRRPEFWKMVERAKREPSITGILVHDSSRFFRDPHTGPMVKGDLLAHGVRVVSATEPEYDPHTIAGLAIEKMTEFKNASYSLDVAFHTRKGMKENLARRDPQIGYCYKNGGAPPWGFAAYRVERGIDRRGLPIMKTLWDKDQRVVAGRPVWEWARGLLVEQRLNGRASLDHLRDFLNDSGVPAPRKKYWSTSSIRALVQPSLLLQYAGYGVWNVRGPHGRKRPPAEWEIVNDAHPAIITLEEAEAIVAINEDLRRIGEDRSKGRMAIVRTATSPYLLTGGLFRCSRCGANMVGYGNRGRLYYICGSQRYRRGLGCGQGLQVRKETIEEALMEEMGRLFQSWADVKRLTQLVNRELASHTQRQNEDSAMAERELADVEQEIDNLRKAVKAGLDDIEWANAELNRLRERGEQLRQQSRKKEVKQEVFLVDRTLIEEHLTMFTEVLASGTIQERRETVRIFVRHLEVDPDSGAVQMKLYSAPPTRPKKRTPGLGKPGAPIGMVAGAGLELNAPIPAPFPTSFSLVLT